MTTGALIFAFNNEKTNYVKLAAWNAERIRRFLRIPVAVVTDSTDHDLPKWFDRVISVDTPPGHSRYFEDYDASVTWHNSNRTDALALSPWDQTLLLDADYVVDSSGLTMVIESDKDFLCFRHSFDLTVPGGQHMLLPTFGRYQFPMWWATVIMFRRSALAGHIFGSMQMIRDHWPHYRDLYGIDRATYRNDHALSIALGLVSGHSLAVDAIPWPMLSVLPGTELRRHDDDWVARWVDQSNKVREISFHGIDFHAMGKKHLETIVANHA